MHALKLMSGDCIAMDIRNIDQVEAFTTKDGSEIRELLAHRNSCIEKQSLAEARLPVGCQTMAHYHPRTEEIYYILEGTGRMQIGQAKQSGALDQEAACALLRAWLREA